MNIDLTLFGEMITFAIFVWVTMRFIWPPIVKAMNERQKKITDGLEAAEKGKRELELAQHKSTTILDKAKDEATNILDNANSRATKILAGAKMRGLAENKKIIANAKVEIEQETFQAQEKLQQEVSRLVVLGAEKILAKEVDLATHERMLQELIKEI